VTLANKITLGRFLLSLVCFGVLGVITSPDQKTLLIVAYALYLVVSLSDALDGWAARRYGEITEIGRIADPMVDKILVCGVLIFTQRIEVIRDLIPTWVIVLVVVREFVVSGIRAAAEAKGIPFPANLWGKVKAAVQMVLAGAAVIYPAHCIDVAWCTWFVVISVWATAVSTLVSGLIYVREAVKIFRRNGPSAA